MKRLLTVLALLLCIPLAACGGKGSAPAPSGGSVTETAKPGVGSPDKVGIGSSSGPVVLKFVNIAEKDSPKGQTAERLAVKIKERFGGRVTMEVEHSSTKYATPSAKLRALDQGEIDMAAPAAGTFQSNEWQMFDLFFAVNYETLQKDLTGELGQVLNESLKTRGLTVLSVWTAGPRHLTNNVRPIRTPEDFRRLRMRIVASPTLSGIMESLKAETTPIAFNKLYDALKTNGVDGQENPLGNIYTKEMHKVQKYMTISGHAWNIYPVTVSTSSWEKLPANVRTELEQLVVETAAENFKQIQEQDAEYLKKIRAESTIEIHEITKEEKEGFRKALAPFYAQWAKQVNPKLAQLLKL